MGEHRGPRPSRGGLPCCHGAGTLGRNRAESFQRGADPVGDRPDREVFWRKLRIASAKASRPFDFAAGGDLRRQVGHSGGAGCHGQKRGAFPLGALSPGGSGPSCSALVTFGYLFAKMLEGKYKRILVITTGALLSPVMTNQKQSIPCIGHAFSLEVVQ